MRPRGTWLVGVACVLGLVAACFGTALFRGGQFAYRDAAHFYYPLYLRVQQEWAAGRVPLWEPEENGGMPLLGNPTAAVLYPGKLIYCGLPYAWGARLYVVAHTLLAVGAMFVLLRHWRVGRAGSALGALAYGFGGPILFQYCNVIFLVGAAWAPLGLRAADGWLRLGRRWSLGELALVLALQTLGGDPQAAYVVGLCAGGYALGLAWTRLGNQARRRWNRRGLLLGVVLLLAWVPIVLAAAQWMPTQREPPKPNEPLPLLPWTPWVATAVLVVWVATGAVVLLGWWRRGMGRTLVPTLIGLAGAGLLAGLLTAAQLLPVREYLAISLRASDQAPHDMYPFSLEPYRVVELAWPNVFGTEYRGNRSWLGVLPPRRKHRVWVPSLYLGGLTMVLALGAFGFRGGPPGRAWLSAIVVASLLASFGQYASPLWAARWHPAWAATHGPHDSIETGSIRFDGQLRDGDGGPYWLLATALPGFGQFRYPSKMLTFTCLGLAGLAGMGWDRLLAGRRGRVLTLAVFFLSVSVGLWAATRVEAARIIATFQTRIGVDASPFGPFDASGALRELRGALAHGGVVFGLTIALMILAARRPRLAGSAALVVLAVDLAVANRGFVVTVPQSTFETQPLASRIIEEAERARPTGGPFRIHRVSIWNPYAWYETATTDRIGDFVRWERDTLQPKHAISLPDRLSYTLTEGTTELYDYWFFFSSFHRDVRADNARALNLPVGQRYVYVTRRGFDLWNTRYFLLPGIVKWDDEYRGVASFLPRTERLYPKLDDPKARDRQRRHEDLQVLRNLDAYPRAWVVHQARTRPTISGMVKKDRQPVMEEILFPNDELWRDDQRQRFDPRELAWLEVDHPETWGLLGAFPGVPRELAWLEVDHPETLAGFLPGTPSDPAERVVVVRNEPQRVELEAELRRPGIVVLADVYYPGWHLTIDGQPAPILRANRMMRGAAVPSGRHRLVFTYEPDSFRVGLWATALGFLSLAGLRLWSVRGPVMSRAEGGRDLVDGPRSG